MTAKLNIRVDRSGMPRSGVLNKPFDLLLDEKPLGALGWGEKQSYSIPAGNHKVALRYKRFDIYYRVDINAKEGETVELDSRMDTRKGGFNLINRMDGKSSDLPGSGSTPFEEQVKIGKAYREKLTIGFCASIGLATFFVLNLMTGGIVPGGFVGGFIGGVLGALAGMGINALRRRSSKR